MSSKSKSVLVRMGAYSRVVAFQSSSDLAASIKAVYEDFPDISCGKLHLQIKDEAWGGEFVDLEDREVPDRSILKALVIAEVSNIGKI